MSIAQGYGNASELQAQLHDVMFERDRLRAENARLREDAERLDWFESQHTLHRSLEVAYVVDGYEIQPLHDDNPSGHYVHGETLRDAIDAARAALGCQDD